MPSPAPAYPPHHLPPPLRLIRSFDLQDKSHFCSHKLDQLVYLVWRRRKQSSLPRGHTQGSLRTGGWGQGLERQGGCAPDPGRQVGVPTKGLAGQRWTLGAGLEEWVHAYEIQKGPGEGSTRGLGGLASRPPRGAFVRPGEPRSVSAILGHV